MLVCVHTAVILRIYHTPWSEALTQKRAQKHPWSFSDSHPIDLDSKTQFLHRIPLRIHWDRSPQAFSCVTTEACLLLVWTSVWHCKVSQTTLLHGLASLNRIVHASHTKK